MRAKQFRAVALAAGLVGWSGLIGPLIPARGQPLVHAALAAALAVSARAPLGLRPPQLWSGLRLGLAAAAPVIIGVAASTAVPPVRSAMAERDLPVSSSRWLAVRIPVGTVWSEEAAFRALEEQVTAELLELPGVLALGGGAVLSPATREALRGHRVVWLRIGLSQAVNRVGLDTARPLLLGNVRGQLLKLLNERAALYDEVATEVVDTDHTTPAEAVDNIMNAHAAQR